MKKGIYFLSVLCLGIAVTACSGKSGSSDTTNPAFGGGELETVPTTIAEEGQEEHEESQIEEAKTEGIKGEEAKEEEPKDEEPKGEEPKAEEPKDEEPEAEEPKDEEPKTEEPIEEPKEEEPKVEEPIAEEPKAEEIREEEPETEEPSSADTSGTVAGAHTNILIAYFTWAENTHVDDPDSVDVDAVTSASVLMPGNVGLMAQWIQEETGGDTFSIITEDAYSSDYDTCLDRAIREHDSGVRPAITGHVDNMEEYDIIFLGFPNWWYSCPMAILTFIDEHDLSGKTIIPFCSHGTGGFAASLRDIGRELPDGCTVLEEFGAYRPEVANSQGELLAWLSGLGIEY